MITDTEIFGGQLVFPDYHPLRVLCDLAGASRALWDKVLKDQFVHKEFAAFYAALLMAEKTIRRVVESETQD